ncbi:hypothetical protein [Empedobacter sp.]|uniref:hypothetical protein n=1 Tax=Empedobacter sp. TaxID=1927715 RepID=UPI00289731E6|nr:hypothetical protein [Empedobacter sp.]
MAQLKHSEEEIIKLGEKLVQELNLIHSTNTLARWMSHYLVELIQNIDKAESKEEKKVLQQECCDIILKIWSKKESLPITKPLDNLKPIIEILQVLKEEKEISILPRWLEYNSLPRDNEWASFVDLVKNNSEKIFSKVIQMNLHKELLSKDQEWLKENKNFLSNQEINFLEFIDVLNDYDFNSGVVDLNNFEISNDNSKRINFIFNEIENLIDNQKNLLLEIKSKHPLLNPQ